MQIEIIMPKMGESVTEGTIIKWHKNIGDPIKKDEVLFEISTDKVDTEIPAQADGVMTEILYKENDTIEVGKVVAYMETALEAAATESLVVPNPVSVTVVQNSATEAAKTLIDIPMPKMGESVMEGTIIKWHKKVGDLVKKDETIFEISTDKVDTEVPSPAEGILAAIVANEQETIPVGGVCGRLETAVVVDAYTNNLTTAMSAAESVSMHDVIAANASVQQPESVTIKDVQPENDFIENTNAFYSPLVMNIAQKEQVSASELSKIKGTGIGGRVTKKDILNYLEIRTNKPVIKPAEVSIPIATASTPKVKADVFEPGFSTGSVERIPMDNIRQKIMQHMIYSRDTSVHVTGLVEVDMSGIHTYIKAKKDILLKQEGIKLTYMAFIAHATVKALRQYPLVNSSIENNAILQKKAVNLGIAVALEPNGLIVPNMKNAHEKNLFGMAKAIGEVAEKARTKKLTPDDISGGTFTITNYGVFGTLFGTPIINQPEVAILGVGAVVKRPVVVEVGDQDAIVVKPMMYLTLSHDHRLVDGMLGGKFLKAIKDNLEQFEEKQLF